MHNEELKDSLKEDLREIISEVSEIDDIPDDKPFQDLGIDSMMAIEIVAEVERKYKISVPEEQLPGLTNLQRVFELVQSKL